MILGLDDIPGGTTFISFLTWVGLTGLYYLVCYLAALNVLDDVTRNSWLKVPVMMLAAIPAAGRRVSLGFSRAVQKTYIPAANLPLSECLTAAD